MKFYFLLILITNINIVHAQPRFGITGGMNLSVLTGTENMETSLKPGIIRQKSATCWEW